MVSVAAASPPPGAALDDGDIAATELLEEGGLGTNRSQPSSELTGCQIAPLKPREDGRAVSCRVT